jgi:hypothetical protein
VSLESDFDNDAALAGEILLLSEKMQKNNKNKRNFAFKKKIVKFLKKKNNGQQKEVRDIH